MYCICFTQNEDNGGHKICRGSDVSVLKQFIIYTEEEEEMKERFTKLEQCINSL